MASPTKSLSIDELNQLATDGIQADEAIFAEQRSNILLITGDHYANRGSRFYNSIRDQKELSKEQKIRLTKNHIQRITKSYVSNILTYAPGTTVMPKNDTEMQDIKAAELHNAVSRDVKERHNFKKKIRQWCEDFVNIGEVAVKVFWDPMAGEFKGYSKPPTEVFGEEGLDSGLQGDSTEPGNPEDKGTPVFSGDFVFERVFGFNLFRPKGCKDMDQAEFIGIQKMTDVDELLIRVGDDEKLKKFVQECKDETYKVFDGANGGYEDVKGQTLLREYYYRPCVKYPMGYFYITTKAGKLWEGELPFGIFPIVFETFEDITTTPRGRSIVKVCRPYQAEINRGGSKVAEHQITLGDDKLIYQAGSKLSNGSILPGVRGIQVSGQAPTILPGRDGSQYSAYVQSQIGEMYQAANMDLDAVEKNQSQMDPYAMLFASIRNKKKFSTYSEKFEQFLIAVDFLTLELAKKYLPDDAIIYAVGRREQVNIPEFKSATKLCYQIKLEPQTEDSESKMGKQLMMNHILQYVGPQLGKDDIGKLIKNMPYANVDESFNDLTIDYENVKNDILALDRGDYPVPNPTDNHEYYVKRITNRIKQADFKYLPQNVKQNYLKKLESHEKLVAEQAQKIKAAQSEFIPIGGAMISCNMYVNDKDNPTKTPKLVRMPYQALDWLIKQLEHQGMGLQKLETMQPAAQAQIAGMMSGPTQPQGAGPGGPPPQQPPGAEMPVGAPNGNQQPVNVGYRLGSR